MSTDSGIYFKKYIFWIGSKNIPHPIANHSILRRNKGLINIFGIFVHQLQSAVIGKEELHAFFLITDCQLSAVHIKKCSVISSQEFRCPNLGSIRKQAHDAK